MSVVLRVKPKVSIPLCLFFCLLYALSLLLFIVVPMVSSLRMLILLGLLVHFVYTIRRYVLHQHSYSISGIYYDDRNRWRLQYRNARVLPVKLLQAVIIGHYFIFLGFRVPGRLLPVALPLAIGSDVADNLRCLRRLLQASC